MKLLFEIGKVLMQINASPNFQHFVLTVIAKLLASTPATTSSNAQSTANIAYTVLKTNKTKYDK